MGLGVWVCLWFSGYRCCCYDWFGLFCLGLFGLGLCWFTGGCAMIFRFPIRVCWVAVFIGGSLSFVVCLPLLLWCVSVICLSLVFVFSFRFGGLACGCFACGILVCD